MAYNKFKQIKSIENFYSTWDKAKYNGLTPKLREYIYNDYLVDCEIFQRDKFTCQNENCKYCKNVPEVKITKHHIKARRNLTIDKGKNHPLKIKPVKKKNTARNQVVICYRSHQAYERGDDVLVFSKDSINLPPHIRGHTFKFSRDKKINWKKHKAEMKDLRKELKIKLSQRIEAIKHLPIEQRRWYDITIEEIIKLMKCLEIPYWEWKDYLR